MRVTKVQEAAEAVCAALFQTDWKLMGESPDGASTWWIRGDKPKQVRVEVQRGAVAEYLILLFEWFNLSQGSPIHGRELFQIPCDSSVTDESIKGATTAGVVRALEIFRDVLTGQGVASAQALTDAKYSTD